jgi:hypothetical protein
MLVPGAFAASAFKAGTRENQQVRVSTICTKRAGFIHKPWREVPRQAEAIIFMLSIDAVQ